MKKRKVNRESKTGDLFGMINGGQYTAFPKSYKYEHEEAKILINAFRESAKNAVGNCDLDNVVNEALMRYQTNLIWYEMQSRIKPDFFDKTSALARAMATTTKPIVKNIKPQLKENNRCNIIIATNLVIRVCNNPYIVGEQVPGIDFYSVYDSEIRNVQKCLAKTLNAHQNDPIPITQVIMNFYINGYNLAKHKKLVLDQ